MTDDVKEAVKDAAAAKEAAAEDASEAAKAEAGKHIADAAVAATAAAEASAALAKAEAAKTIEETGKDLEWLHQHATQTENSLKELRENQDRLAQSIPAAMEAAQASMLEKISALLTPQHSKTAEEPKPGEVKPEEESEEEVAQEEQRKKKASKQTLKLRRNWI